MKLYVDGSIKQVCYVFPDEAPVVTKIRPGQTTNEAEYAAVSIGLQEAKNRGLHDITVLSDSQLVVNQMNRRLNRVQLKKGEIGFATKSVRLYNLGSIVRYLAIDVGATLEWAPREENLAGLHLDSLGKKKKGRKGNG